MMRTDIAQLKANHDLRQLVEQDLGTAPIHSGRFSLWKCPFHNERLGYSLAVWANGYRCFGKCSMHGDALDWLQKYRNLQFSDALHVLGQPRPRYVPNQTRIQPAVMEPPPEAWQAAAKAIVHQAVETLWSDAGHEALAYLLNRGLTTTTIRQAQLGYVTGTHDTWRDLNGLKVPCGITIPWYTSGALWAVKVRRSNTEPKYVQIAGSSSGGLYNADAVSSESSVLFCEGEFDSLLVSQEASDLVTSVTLGSASNRLPARWHTFIQRAPAALITYDNDEAGKRGALRLRQVSNRFRILNLPHSKDVGEFFLSGGDLHAWIDGELNTGVEVLNHVCQ